VSSIDFGSLRKLKPVNAPSKADRGLPVERYYVEHFLKDFAKDIRGNVLEVFEDIYCKKFGKDPKTTVMTDLARSFEIPSDTYDCAILIQSLQHLYDVRAGVRAVYRVLKPGGVALFTAHNIGPQTRQDLKNGGEYWHFTSLSMSRLLEEYFPPEMVKVRRYGNVLSATACLQGIPASDLTAKELDYNDPDYEVIVAARAVKPIRDQA
jgi:SAM-dependent methyltransferase